MNKRMYRVPRLITHGTVTQLTRQTNGPIGIKQLAAPSDGNYLGSLDNPLNGSCICIDKA